MWELVTNAIGHFFSALRGFLPGIVGRVLIALGIGVTSYTFLLPEILSWVQGYFNVLSPETLSLLGAMNIDRAFNLVISAINAKFGLKLTAISFTPAAS